MLLSSWSAEDVAAWLRQVLPAGGPAFEVQQCATVDGAALLAMKLDALRVLLLRANASEGAIDSVWQALWQLRHQEELANEAAALRLMQQDCQEARDGALSADSHAIVVQLEELQRAGCCVDDAILAAGYAQDALQAAALATQFRALAAMERDDALIAARLGGVAPPATPPAAADQLARAASGNSTSGAAASASSSASTSSGGGAAAAQCADRAIFQGPGHLERGCLTVVQVGAWGSASSVLAHHHHAGIGKGKAPAVAGASSVGVPITDAPPSTRQAMCDVCYEGFIDARKTAQFNLPCGQHSYCNACMRVLLKESLRDSSMLPLFCCGVEMDCESLGAALLAGDDLQTFRHRLEQATVREKMFCPHHTCSAFINLDKLTIRGQHACPDCGKSMCTHCKVAWHDGLTCEQFQQLPAELRETGDDAALVAVAAELGWRRCRRCRYFVSLSQGCNHITCRCGDEFCYVCAAPWKTCACPQWDETNLMGEARQRVEVQARAERRRLNAAEFNAALQHTIGQLREDNHECSTHDWEHRCPPLAASCQNCRTFHLWRYCYHCRDCHMVVCHTCRFHRIRDPRT